MDGKFDRCGIIDNNKVEVICGGSGVLATALMNVIINVSWVWELEDRGVVGSCSGRNHKTQRTAVPFRTTKARIAMKKESRRSHCHKA